MQTYIGHVSDNFVPLNGLLVRQNEAGYESGGIYLSADLMTSREHSATILKLPKRTHIHGLHLNMTELGEKTPEFYGIDKYSFVKSTEKVKTSRTIRRKARYGGNLSHLFSQEQCAEIFDNGIEVASLGWRQGDTLLYDFPHGFDIYSESLHGDTIVNGEHFVGVLRDGEIIPFLGSVHIEILYTNATIGGVYYGETPIERVARVKAIHPFASEKLGIKPGDLIVLHHSYNKFRMEAENNSFVIRVGGEDMNFVDIENIAGLYTGTEEELRNTIGV
jgi:hypothetical protein